MARVHKTKRREKHPGKRLLHSLIIMGILAIVYGGGWIVDGFKSQYWHHGIARVVAGAVPFPAASINGESIKYGDVAEMANYFEIVIGVHQDQSFLQGLEYLKRLAYMEQLATELQIETSAAQEFESLAYLGELGWSKKDHEKYIEYPHGLQIALEEEVMQSEEYQAEAIGRVVAIQSDLDVGFEFSGVATQRSAHLSAQNGGDIGYFELGDLPEGYESLVELEVDQVSEILQTETYFFIAYVYDYVEADEPQIGIKIITVDKQGLSSALNELMEESEEVYHISMP